VGAELERREEERWHIGERRGDLFNELPQSTCDKLSTRGVYIDGWERLVAPYLLKKAELLC
jgi:hypothetical protein